MASEAMLKLKSLDGKMVLDNTYLEAIKGLSKEQAQLALSTTKLSQAKQNEILINAGYVASSKNITYADLEEILTKEKLDNELKESILLKYQEINAETGQIVTTKVLTQEEIKELLSLEVLDEELKENLRLKLLNVGGNISLAESFKLLTAKIWGAVKAIGSFLFTNPVGWCILAVSAIAGVVIGYNAYIKKIHEAAEEARKSIDEIKSSYDDLSSSVNNVKTRYAELAQEVGNLGKLNQNAGTLSTDEYEEFLDLSNQLSELFPQLTKGYDDNGNAILNLSGNVNTIVGSLNDLVKVQKDLANQEIIEKMPKVWDGYALDVKEYQKEINKINDEISEVSTNISNQSSWYKTDNSELNNALKSAFEKSGITNVEDYYQRVYNDIFGYTGTRWDFSKLSDEQIAEIKQYWDSYAVEYQKQANDAQKKIDANNIEMKKYFSMWFSSDSAYGSKTDPEKNQIMQYLMSSFDLGIFQEELDGKEWDEVTEWIENNILLAISSVNDEEIQHAILSVLSGDYDSFPELKELYSIIQSYFKPNDPIMLYFDTNFGDLANNYNTITDNAAKRFSGITDGELNTSNINSGPSAKAYQENLKRYQEEKQALDDFARENKINTQDQIALWNQCIKESLTREDAMKKYLQESISETPPPTITETVDAISNELKPALESLKSSYTSIFSEDGFKAGNVHIDDISSVKSALDNLKEEYKLEIDYEEYEDFVKVITDTDAEASDVQEAFNSMASMMVNASSAVKLTEENFDLLQTQLENLGITNAKEVLTDMKNVQEELADVGIDLQNTTLEEAEAFIYSAEASATATHYLQMYHLEKELANNPLNTSADIAALEQTCSALNITGEYWKSLIRLKSLYYAAEHGGLGTELQDEIQQEKANLDALYKDQYKYKVDLEFDGNIGGSGSGEGSGSEYDWKNLLDKEIAVLEKQLDAGLIDFDTYLGKRLDLIEKYYQEGKIKAEDYYEYLEKTYENQLSIYDRVISAVTNKLEKQIEQLEKQKEAIEEGYQLQIDKLNEEIELLEKEYQKKKDLEELEQARYNAEKARNQRTKRVK